MTSIQEILPLETSGIISLTGAGGKTSLMFSLAHILAGTGKRVLTTTTTKIFPPFPSQSKTVLIFDSIDKLLIEAGALVQEQKHMTAVAATIHERDKLKGFSSGQIHNIHNAGIFDWIIVEADGAAKKPLKAPADHEPVIPENTTIWIGVVGLDVVGKPLTETHTFRSDLISHRIGLPLGETILEHHVVSLLMNPYGYLKGVPPRAYRCIFLNKADTSKAVESGRKIVDYIRHTGPGKLNAVIIGQAKEGLMIHDHFSF
ncbi:MAG: putative selenium-dependent hydroxylase accessory protein YqeC [Deltaproteobacteria bacterium]|nr:putative selenium-dependent hydroxylase accessory protein YqeC [Deltaproteobacteria bacterium]